MAVTNASIFQAAKLVGTSDYQQAIDPLSQGALKGTAARDFWFAQPSYVRNQFLDFLVNRIGMTYVNHHTFRNPLAALKRGTLQYGNVAQNIALDWTKARSYFDTEPGPGEERAALFGTFRDFEAGSAVQYTAVNSRRLYPVTVNREELATAFLSDTGLSDFVAAIMEVPVNQDNYDEYRLMLNLLKNYDDANPNTLYRHKAYDVNGYPNDAEQSAAFLKDLRVYAEKVRFPNQARLYTPADVPGAYSRDDLTLLITPEALASIDVDKLAMVFNLDRASIEYAMIVVDEMPVKGCFAALIANSNWSVYDKLYENTSQYDPMTLSTNYFLHHWTAAAISGLAPIIMFGASKTEDGEETGWSTPEVVTITETATGVTLTAASDHVARGGTDQLTLALNGTLEASDGASINPHLTVAPDSATFEVTAPDGVALNSRTYVDALTGILHVQKSIASGTVLTVTATGTYQNPTSATLSPATPYTSTVQITVA